MMHYSLSIASFEKKDEIKRRKLYVRYMILYRHPKLDFYILKKLKRCNQWNLYKQFHYLLIEQRL